MTREKVTFTVQMCENMINWRALSTQITSKPLLIRKNSVPVKHREQVNKLLQAIQRVFEGVDTYTIQQIEGSIPKYDLKNDIITHLNTK